MSLDSHSNPVLEPVLKETQAACLHSLGDVSIVTGAIEGKAGQQGLCRELS